MKAAPQPLTLDAIADALRVAAEAEGYAVNLMEVEAARPGEAAAIFQEALAGVRAQARALGAAHSIFRRLSRDPSLRLGGDATALSDLAAELGDE